MTAVVVDRNDQSDHVTLWRLTWTEVRHGGNGSSVTHHTEFYTERPHRRVVRLRGTQEIRDVHLERTTVHVHALDWEPA